MPTQKDQLIQGEDISIFNINLHNFEIFGVDLNRLTEQEVEQLIMDMRGRAVKAFVEARRELLNAAKEIATAKVDFLTTATENYDGFGTCTVERWECQDSKGQHLRKVAIYSEHLQWQEMRYGSGGHLAFAAERWTEFEHLFEPIS